MNFKLHGQFIDCVRYINLGVNPNIINPNFRVFTDKPKGY